MTDKAYYIKDVTEEKPIFSLSHIKQIISTYNKVKNQSSKPQIYDVNGVTVFVEDSDKELREYVLEELVELFSDNYFQNYQNEL